MKNEYATLDYTRMETEELVRIQNEIWLKLKDRCDEYTLALINEYSEIGEELARTEE